MLGKERRMKKPWITKDVLNLCDDRRDLKKRRCEAEGTKVYREADERIQRAVKKAKEDCIGFPCEEIETCQNKNNSKRAYQLVKDLTSEKHGRSTLIQGKSGKCLTKNRRFSADGQNIAQNYTIMRVMVTMQFWTAISSKKIYNQFFVRKLRLQGLH